MAVLELLIYLVRQKKFELFTHQKMPSVSHLRMLSSPSVQQLLRQDALYKYSFLVKDSFFTCICTLFKGTLRREVIATETALK